MPWVLQKNEDGETCVHKENADGTAGELVKCHASPDDAKAHMAALYANEPGARNYPGVKMLYEDDQTAVIAGYGMVWGDETRKDLTGEFFTPDTRGLDDLPVKVMTLEHDMETDEAGQPIKDIVGHTIAERNTSRGRWVEAQIDKTRRYARHVLDLLDQGKLYLSSETALHWREVADTGEIKRWRTAGYTFTTHPAEPRIGAVEQIKAAYKSAGLQDPEPEPEPGPEHDAGAGAPGADELAAVKARTVARIDIALAEIDMEVLP